jgi:hypothetical protein
MDTISLSLTQDKFNYLNLLRICQYKFEYLGESKSKNSLFSFRYSYKDMFIQINEFHLYISGSLSTFYHGNSVKNMTFKDIIDALNLLSHLLQTDLRYGKLSRVDFAFNLIMNHYVCLYLETIGEPIYFTKTTTSRASVKLTKGRGNNSQAMLFYDKYLKYKKSERENLFSEDEINMLRFEAQLSGSYLRKHFGDIWIADLYEETTYIKLLDHWLASYMMVPKETIPIIKPIDFSKPSTVGASLKDIGLRVVGGKQKLLRLLKSSPTPAKKQAPIRAMIQRDFTDEEFVDFDFREELDDKIQAMYNAEISSLSIRKNAA